MDLPNPSTEVPVFDPSKVRCPDRGSLTPEQIEFYDLEDWLAMRPEHETG